MTNRGNSGFYHPFLLYLAAQRLAPVPYHVGIAGASIAMAAGTMVHAEAVFQDILLKLLILVIYCGMLLVSRTITRDDLSLFWNINWYGRRAENEALSGQTGDLR